MTDKPVIGYLMEPDEYRKLCAIVSALHGGTDRERDFGHRLWCIECQVSAMPILEGELQENGND